MRGKVTVAILIHLTFRITPAYAGKRNHWQKKTSLRKDHPRLCGEKVRNAVYGVFLLGSPPPMRGKAARTLINDNIIRITPAYAGKSHCGI